MCIAASVSYHVLRVLEGWKEGTEWQGQHDTLAYPITAVPGEYW